MLRLFRAAARRHSAPRLRVESCEQRVLLAGNLTAVLEDGNLTITGDDNANAAVLKSVGAQTVLRGVSGTTINGSSDVFVINVDTPGLIHNLNIDLRGGNDTFKIYNIGLSGEGLIEGGAGNDRIGIEGYNSFGTIIRPGEGKDATYLKLADSRPMIVEDLEGPALIHLDFTGANLSVTTGPSKDRILYTTRVSSVYPFNLDTGGGNDVIRLQGALFHDHVIQTGAGNDLLEIVAGDPDELTLGMGDGKDALLLTGNGQYPGPTTLDGQEGSNSVYVAPETFKGGSFTQQNFQTELTSPAKLVAKITKSLKKLDFLDDFFATFGDA